MNEIDALYSDIEEMISPAKILCIFEGKDELNFVKKVYELYHSDILCEDFLEDKVELAWGKDPILWHNREECNFRGGNLAGCPVPQPVIESFEQHDLEDYKGILVMFDSDCDTNNEVKILSNDILNSYNYCLFISSVCFEREAITLLGDDNTENYILKNYKILGNSLCKWYKSNYANLPKKDYFRRVRSLEKLIERLRLEDIKNESLVIHRLIDFVHRNI